MRYGIFNGDYVGTAEWVASGEVVLDIADPQERAWFEHYFATEDSVMAAAGDHEGMILERRDASEAAFNRAMYQLAGHSYEVRQSNDRHFAAQRAAAT